MIINLRNALMTGKRLPYDAEVEYLESSGTQYIDTGVYGDSDTVAELTFAMTDNSRADAGIFGSRKGYQQDCFIISRVGSSQGAFWMHYGNESTNANFISTVIGNTTAWHTARLARSWSIDTSTGTAGQFTFTTPTTLKVFAADTSASGRWYAKMRLASLKIYSNNLLVRDCIPVRKGTTGELYDRVSGKFAERHGDFVVGQDVVPVEYIESHGTEYINLDYLQADILRVKFGASISSNYSTGEMDIVGNQAPTAGAGRFVLGVYDTKFFAYSRYDSVNDGNATSNTISKDVMYSVVCTYNTTGNTKTLTVNGQDYTVDKCTNISNAINRVRLFAAANGVMQLWQGRLAYMTMWKDGAKWNDLKAIRVGTEGAMMDTLTRRIYRNAGTGAFGYGNDLKYPIPAS